MIATVVYHPETLKYAPTYCRSSARLMSCCGAPCGSATRSAVIGRGFWVKVARASLRLWPRHPPAKQFAPFVNSSTFLPIILQQQGLLRDGLPAPDDIGDLVAPRQWSSGVDIRSYARW